MKLEKRAGAVAGELMGDDQGETTAGEVLESVTGEAERIAKRAREIEEMSVGLHDPFLSALLEHASSSLRLAATSLRAAKHRARCLLEEPPVR